MEEHRRLGNLLLAAGAITEEQLEAGLERQRRTGQYLGVTLIQMGLLTEEILLQALQRQLGLPLVDLEQMPSEEQALCLIKEEIARKHTALPLEVLGKSTLLVAVSDPLNMAALEDLRFHSGLFVKPVLASASAIREGIDRCYHLEESVGGLLQGIIDEEAGEVVVSAVHDSGPSAEELLHQAEDAPIVRLTHWLLARAVAARASDIHLEPQERSVSVRLRVDGLLEEIRRLPKWAHGAMVSRLKSLSGLDLAEKRRPQDGRMMMSFGGRRMDVRVSTLPTTGGEKVVIRVVDSLRAPLELESFGFEPPDLQRYESFLRRPQGIVVVSGPAGSGKSTLLYASLRRLQDVSRNIVTVEDPVELHLRGINQVQVDEKGKKTFPLALRAILRQDPDIIMVGEIRDRETAQIAFRAAVTGHLVLTAVHADDTASAVTRLVDLGLEPYMVASSLTGVVSQRLVRVICPRCREPYQGDPTHQLRLGRTHGDRAAVLHRGRGCAHCRQSGYLGRTGIFELLEIDEPIRALIAGGADDASLRRAAGENGMRSLGQDGIGKVLAGTTTLEEVSRVIYLADQTARICPSCGQVLAREFEYCPACRAFVGEHCTSCRRKLNPEWTFCPFCGETARGRGEAEDSAPLARAA